MPITVSGNAVADPALRFTGSGTPSPTCAAASPSATVRKADRSAPPVDPAKLRRAPKKRAVASHRIAGM